MAEHRVLVLHGIDVGDGGHGGKSRIGFFPVLDPAVRHIEDIALGHELAPEDRGAGGDDIAPFPAGPGQVFVRRRIRSGTDEEDVDADGSRAQVRPAAVQRPHGFGHDIPGPGPGAELLERAVVNADDGDIRLSGGLFLVKPVGNGAVGGREYAGGRGKGKQCGDGEGKDDVQDTVG